MSAFGPASEMDIRKRLGLNIRNLRKAKGLSQEKFAFDADIHRTYVSDVERGRRNPTVTVVEKFAKTLSVSPGYLLDTDPHKKR